jgi:hypothetical protein
MAIQTKPYRVAALLVVMLAGVAAGAGQSAARLSACRHADVVFYTTDTVRLATELSKSASSCSDYYLSVTPTATGAPRGDPPVTAIHSLGPRFHALAEIRLNLWAGYAKANGWYAAGVEVRRQMRAAGYDVSRGDSWAINEVGAPSGTQMGVDVLKNTGTARQDLREFVRGLSMGDDGVASRGLVFAADPLQVATDLTQYKQDLRSWYFDSAFWQDMARSVRFWAQETYADARTWGVAGSTLAERAAYLNDYFLHGSRLAAAGDGRTDAARTFFATAYTPVGNGSYRWPNPDATSGIGFGSTDTGLTEMLGFVSTQTHALRSSSPERFGFAFVPHAAAASETLAVADRLAAAIQSSETDPSGACGASDESCEGTLAGAAFIEAWKTFTNTLEGAHVVVRVGPAVKVTYATVISRGATQVTTSSVKRRPPPRFQGRSGAVAYEIETTAAYSRPAEVCIAHEPTTYQESAPHLFRLAGRSWTEVTTVTARRFICGKTQSLGTFAIFAAAK